MKYFTPARYLASQTRDQDAAEIASQDWELQIDAYQKRLKEIKKLLPKSVNLFRKTCHLHDFWWDNWGELSYSAKKVELIFRDKRFICILRYKLAFPGHAWTVTDSQDRLIQIIHKDECFHPESRCWLYDEWDYLGEVQGTKVFSHSFLMSNGFEFKMVFSDFKFIFIPIGKGFVEA